MCIQIEAKVNGSWFEVKMYEKGQTMEEISEGWVEVMTTNENGPKELNFFKKLLKAQLDEIVVLMHVH